MKQQKINSLGLAIPLALATTFTSFAQNKEILKADNTLQPARGYSLQVTIPEPGQPHYRADHHCEMVASYKNTQKPADILDEHLIIYAKDGSAGHAPNNIIETDEISRIFYVKVTRNGLGKMSIVKAKRQDNKSFLVYTNEDIKDGFKENIYTGVNEFRQIKHIIPGVK